MTIRGMEWIRAGIGKRAPRWLAAAMLLSYALVSLNLFDFVFHGVGYAGSAEGKGSAQAEAITLPGAAPHCECRHEAGEPCMMGCCAKASGPAGFGDGHRLCACDGPGSHGSKELIPFSFHLVPTIPDQDFRFREELRPAGSEIDPPSFPASPPEKIPIA